MKSSFVIFGEGITPNDEYESPVIGRRLIGLSELKEIRVRVQIDSLMVHPSKISIKVGETFSLQNLIVTALDSNDKIVKHIPFSLAYEKIKPIIEAPKENPHLIKGIKSGQMYLRISSLVPRPDGTYPKAFVKLRIHR